MEYLNTSEKDVAVLNKIPDHQWVAFYRELWLKPDADADETFEICPGADEITAYELQKEMKNRKATVMTDSM